MGTDYGSFLEEAARVLRYKGWLWIAEVRSRFTGGPGGEEPPQGKQGVPKEDLKPFLKCLGRLGFNVDTLDTTSNTMFFVAVLRKLNVAQGDPTKTEWPQLRACMKR